MVSLGEELLEPVELLQAQSRKLRALAGLGYLGVRQAVLLNVIERGCLLLNWGTRKPID